MNTAIPEVGAAFLAAARSGTSTLPARVLETLEDCEAWPNNRVLKRLEAFSLKLSQDFSFLNAVQYRPSMQHDQQQDWICAIRGMLDEFRLWHQDDARTQRRLRVLLTALGVLCINTASLRSVSSHLAPSVHAPSFIQLIESEKLNAWGDSADKAKAGRILSGIASGKLGMAFHLQELMVWRLDIAVAISLLYESSVVDCARSIDGAPNVLSGVLASSVLGPDSLSLAIHVESLPFKLLCLFSCSGQARDEEPTDEQLQLLEDLVVQLSTSGSWEACLAALRLPTRHQSVNLATGRALARMDAQARHLMLANIELLRTSFLAEPMEVVLQEFARRASAEDAAVMWKMAFEHWDAHDYGSDQANVFHSSAPLTPLDFAVASYYAGLPPESRDQEEQRLSDRIGSVELQWFESFSKLMTARSMLMARLNLVRRGRSMAAGNIANQVPLASVTDRYQQVRYRA